MRNNLLLR